MVAWELLRAFLTPEEIKRLRMGSRAINTYDIDGVIMINDQVGGLTPNFGDVIITGRSIEEKPETIRMLHDRRLFNIVIMNPTPFNKKSRKNSGIHKGTVLNTLVGLGFKIGCHFEDDAIQVREIKKRCSVPIVHLVHNLTEKNNVRRPYP